MLISSRESSCSRRVMAAIVTLAFVLALDEVRAQVRPEIHPVQTVTLSTQQVLLGDQNGKPTILAGELRIPAGSGRLPAVILVHGSGGLSEAQEFWAFKLNEIGVAAFLLDSFSGRGITSTVEDQSQLDSLAMLVDAYRSLGMLAKRSRIDSSRIAVMGFSKGGVAALYSSNERFRKTYAPPNVEFAAHIGLYTPCNTTYRDDGKVTGKPIRLFHGIADDYVSIGPCREYVERLKNTGVDITLTEFPGAYHTYDNASRKGQAEPTLLPLAASSRNCKLIEGEHGAILNSNTNKPYDVNKDPCIERDAHVAYNEAATNATVKAVKEFLIATFLLKP
jgi:dienelactone hydrolase